MEMFRNGRTASFEQIKTHLEKNDMDISPRTLQRDINQIRVDFSVDIVYNRQLNCYTIDQETSIGLPGFYKFLELSLTTELLQDHLRENKESILKYVQFEPLESFHGFQNLKVILQAILLKRWVSFDYTRFIEDSTKTHSVIPCLLKRYQGRWYLIGRTSTNKNVTFGLDRMSNLKATTKSFSENEIVIPEELDDVVGLQYTGKPERVVLQFTPLQAKYIETLPLHHSQKKVSKTKEGILYEYKLIPNYELVQAILRLGDQVKVLEPTSLKDEVIQIINSILQTSKN